MDEEPPALLPEEEAGIEAANRTARVASLMPTCSRDHRRSPRALKVLHREAVADIVEASSTSPSESLV
jgi:hypothetical protein